MTVTEQNIDVWVAGDEKNLIVTITDEDGDPVDTTGSTATYGITKEPGDTSVVSLSSGGGDIDIATPTTSQVTVKVTETDTSGLKGIYHHQLQLVDSGGVTYTAMIGTINFIGDSA